MIALAFVIGKVVHAPAIVTHILRGKKNEEEDDITS